MILFLNDLTVNEFFHFETFLHSPYFSRVRNIKLLFDYIKPFYPNIKPEHISYESISNNVLNENKVNKIKIRKLISDFSKLIESYLLQVEMENDRDHNKFLLLNALRKRGLAKRFNSELRTFLESKGKTFSKDDNYYLTDINVYDSIFYFNFSNFKLKFADILQSKSDSIDHLFLFLKLHIFNEMMENEAGRDLKFNKKFFNEVINYVRENKKEISSNHPNIYVIYLVVLMNMSGDDLYVEELKRYLKSNENKLDMNKLNYYYHYIRAYYVVKINSGKIQYREDLFEIFKLMNKKRLFIIDNTITDMEFNSVVNTVLALKEYKWVNNFIEEYKEYLHPDFANDSYNLSVSKLLYHKKDFDGVFEHLNKVEFKDPFYYYNSKFLLARVHYDTKNYMGVTYITENLKQYSRFNKFLKSDQKSVIKVFNKYMNELLRLTEMNLKKRGSMKTVLRKQIENEKTLVTNVNWFYEKIDKL
ncbi:MAG TPA: hypothetical protein PKA90_01910 [Ignavibacteria bacterium]|nr:hypothetical protein [Ignavibacteria bacterium]HMR39163.1 hypothetical protein [Ignavibacteria bacterium]